MTSLASRPSLDTRLLLGNETCRPPSSSRAQSSPSPSSSTPSRNSSARSAAPGTCRRPIRACAAGEARSKLEGTSGPTARPRPSSQPSLVASSGQPSKKFEKSNFARLRTFLVCGGQAGDFQNRNCGDVTQRATDLHGLIEWMRAMLNDDMESAHRRQKEPER